MQQVQTIPAVQLIQALKQKSPDVVGCESIILMIEEKMNQIAQTERLVKESAAQLKAAENSVVGITAQCDLLCQMATNMIAKKQQDEQLSAAQKKDTPPTNTKTENKEEPKQAEQKVEAEPENKPE